MNYWPKILQRLPRLKNNRLRQFWNEQKYVVFKDIQVTVNMLEIVFYDSDPTVLIHVLKGSGSGIRQLSIRMVHWSVNTPT